MLKEVDAQSESGDKIIVEQIFEKTINTQIKDSAIRWAPMSKIVITDKVINLSDDLTFVHPRTGKVFRVSS